MGVLDNRSIVNKTVKKIGKANWLHKTDATKFDFAPYLATFKDEELLTDILAIMAFSGMDFTYNLDYVMQMYNLICIGRYPNEEEKIFKSLVSMYAENEELFKFNNNFEKVVSAFDDKRIVVEYFNYLLETEEIIDRDDLELLSHVVDYVQTARQYYVDDRALFVSAIKLIKEFAQASYYDEEDVEKIVEARLREDRKANGIYEIDRYALAELDQKISEMTDRGSELATIMETADSTVKSLRSAVDGIRRDVRRTKENEIRDLQLKSNGIIAKFESTYSELLSQERESLYTERESLMSDVAAQIERGKTELTTASDNIAKRAALELGHINSAANGAIERIKEIVSNNAEVRKLLAEAKTDDDFLARLAAVEKMASQLPSETPQIIPSAKTGETVPTEKVVESTPIVTAPTIVIPKIEVREVDPTVNYYFDKRIPFGERFARLVEEKEKDAKSNGTLYHEKFDDAAKIVMVGKKPLYIYGPSGTGKNHMIVQLADLLKMKVVRSGYISYEQEVLGYTNSSTGSYVPSNFYHGYKYGDIIFYDEYDAGAPNAAIALNSFTEPDNKDYTFPDGVTVERHPNFRIIAAGNTKGNGRTQAFHTRSKMDQSVRKRWEALFVGYDPKIEMSTLKTYPNWFEFASNFRKAIEELPTDDSSRDDIDSFTTRDADTIRTYLDDKVFPDDKIMELEIVGTKDTDYLSQIGEQMDKMSFSQGGKKLLKTYHSVCDSRRGK